MCCNKSLISPLIAAVTLLQLKTHTHTQTHTLFAFSPYCLSHHRVSFCALSSSFSPIHKFSLTALPLQTRGSIVLPKMPRSPRPSTPVHSVCVCVCVPVREQLSHSAVTCCTAETDRYRPRQLSLFVSFPLS